MRFHQTPTHKKGKGSFHQIGLVRGQFGNVPEATWIPFLQQSGFDGWEEASWELDLRRCDTDEGAAHYAQERVTMAKTHALEIFTVATHLQGQVLGDEPSAKTLNFCSGKGDAKAAYKAWRAAGNNPPRTAATTSAFRRITQRRVFFGGRSAIVSGLPSGPITYLTRGRICTVILLSYST